MEEKTYYDFTDELDEMIDLYLKFDNHKKFFEKYNENNTNFSNTDFMIFQFVLMDVMEGLNDIYYHSHETDAKYTDVLTFIHSYKNEFHPKELIYNLGFNKQW